MATFNKVNDFVEAVAEKVHNLGSDQLAVALSNTAPASETSNPTATGNGILANVTQVAYTNLSSRNITTTSSEEASGTYKLILADLTLTSTGGDTGPFRYIYIYNDTATNDDVIAYYDYGGELTLTDGDSLTIDFDGAGGFLTIA